MYHTVWKLTALAVVVVAIVYGYVLNRRDPELGDRAGSIVADE